MEEEQGANIGNDVANSRAPTTEGVSSGLNEVAGRTEEEQHRQNEEAEQGAKNGDEAT